MIPIPINKTSFISLAVPAAPTAKNLVRHFSLSLLPFARSLPTATKHCLFITPTKETGKFISLFFLPHLLTRDVKWLFCCSNFLSFHLILLSQSLFKSSGTWTIIFSVNFLSTVVLLLFRLYTQNVSLD